MMLYSAAALVWAFLAASTIRASREKVLGLLVWLSSCAGAFALAAAFLIMEPFGVGMPSGEFARGAIVGLATYALTGSFVVWGAEAARGRG